MSLVAQQNRWNSATILSLGEVPPSTGKWTNCLVRGLSSCINTAVKLRYGKSRRRQGKIEEEEQGKACALYVWCVTGVMGPRRLPLCSAQGTDPRRAPEGTGLSPELAANTC